MSTDTALLEYFTKIEASGGVVVKDAPKLDIQQYIGNYEGRTRFDRLMHIGRSSVPLCVPALKAAVAEAQNGKDVARYAEAWEHLRAVAPGEADAEFSPDWVVKTESEYREKTAHLEGLLKNYKNNLVKDSIRMGNEDLALHYEELGNLDKAFEHLQAMRTDIGTTEQLVGVSKHQIRIAVLMRDWNTLTSHVSKLHGVQIGDKREDMFLARYVRIARGLASLAAGLFDETARCFLHLEGSSGPDEARLASPNDVAVYGALCALATMDRAALQSKVLDNQQFRQALELEPHLRRAISSYVGGRFTATLEVLEAYRSDFLLDMYLFKWVPALLDKVRSKCIVQFFYPYSCVSLATLQEAFGVSRNHQSLEHELRELIRQGSLNARINTIDGLLRAVIPDPRAEMQKSAIDLVDDYEKRALERIRRMSIAAAGLESKVVKTGTAPTMSLQGSSDMWFDEGPLEKLAA